MPLFLPACLSVCAGAAVAVNIAEAVVIHPFIVWTLCGQQLYQLLACRRQLSGCWSSRHATMFASALLVRAGQLALIPAVKLLVITFLLVKCASWCIVGWSSVFTLSAVECSGERSHWQNTCGPHMPT